MSGDGCAYTLCSQAQPDKDNNGQDTRGNNFGSRALRANVSVRPRPARTPVHIWRESCSRSWHNHTTDTTMDGSSVHDAPDHAVKPAADASSKVGHSFDAHVARCLAPAAPTIAAV